MKKQDLLIIGWREWLDLPELGIKKIKAKIDTGARSSALHAFDIEHFQDNGKDLIRFQVHPYQRNIKDTVVTQAELIEWRSVRNSGGIAQLRPVIKTTVELRKQQWAIELTLTNRDVMGFRMLLGREAIRRGFLVDPGHSFLLSDSSKA